MAGTPCPFMGKIGSEAQALWDKNPELKPENIEQEQRRNDQLEGAVKGASALGILLLLLQYSTTEVNQYGVDCSLTPWMSSCGDDWKTQEGMTEYSISDDGNVQVPIPFDFPYGYDGRTFTNSWMFSNGVVGFMSPTGSFCCNGIDVANGDWSNYTGLPYFSFSIAALWTDLINLNVDIDGDGIKDSGFFTQEVDTDNDGQVDTLRYLWRNISEYYNRDTAN